MSTARRHFSAPVSAFSATTPPAESTYIVPSITIGVNSLPLKLALSPDGKTLAAGCAGRWHGLALIDLATEQTKQWVPLDRDFIELRPERLKTHATRFAWFRR